MRKPRNQTQPSQPTKTRSGPALLLHSFSPQPNPALSPVGPFFRVLAQRPARSAQHPARPAQLLLRPRIPFPARGPTPPSLPTRARWAVPSPSSVPPLSRKRPEIPAEDLSAAFPKPARRNLRFLPLFGPAEPCAPSFPPPTATRPEPQPPRQHRSGTGPCAAVA